VINLGFSGHGLMHQEVLSSGPVSKAPPHPVITECRAVLITACACAFVFVQVASAIAEIDAAVYVLDCEWNMLKYVEQVPS
jgi:hypothetical protein